MSGNVKNALMDFFSGDFILTKRLDKQLGFVIYVFILLCLTIFWGLYVENKLVKVEDNNREIKTLIIARDQNAIELLKIDSRKRVEELLDRNNSKLKAPVRPARTIQY